MSEVRVTVAGPVGCGKSAIAGEIEIAMKAIGVPVRFADERDAQSEKNMTGADWAGDIEMYQPSVVIEEAVPRPSEVERMYGLLWLVTTEDRRLHEARKIALGRITKEGQRRGIEWAKQKFREPDAGYEAVRKGL